MNRLQRLLKRKRQLSQKLLSVYITAGFPELDSTQELVLAAEASGADFVEVGMPFSDPIADGPTIQESSRQALLNGMNLRYLLGQVREIRQETDLPLLLMSYMNPVMQFGLHDLIRDFEASGGDGFIIPDLLPDHPPQFTKVFTNSDIGLNFLVTPNSSPERIALAGDSTDSFLYCVSVTGVTGTRQGVPADLNRFLARTRQAVDKPLLVGFGISSASDAAAIAEQCDGVIVGSAAIKTLISNDMAQKKLEVFSNLIEEFHLSLSGE